MRLFSHGRIIALAQAAILAGSALACSSDGSCVYYPCPLPEAALISVTAASAPAGIPGLAMTVTGAMVGGGPCTQAPVSVCVVMGGPGAYQVELTAPGYVGVELKFTVTGTSAGCNTCGHVDRKDLSVVMQPTG